MTPKVYFADFCTRNYESLPKKLARLILTAGMDQIDFEGKFVAIVMVKSNDVKTSEAEALTKAQKKDLGERPAYVFSIISGKEILDEDIEGNFVMQIPYKTRYKETEEGLKVYLIDEDGKRTAEETSYNENTDKVVWNADSLGFYVIEHEAAKK